MKIGTKIRQLRDLKGYSQEALATEINVSQKQLSRYETDETSPTLEMVEKIAGALEIDVHELLEFDGARVFTSNSYNQQGGEYYNQQGVKCINVNHSETQLIKELHEKLLAAKDETIEALRHEIEILKTLRGA